MTKIKRFIVCCDGETESDKFELKIEFSNLKGVQQLITQLTLKAFDHSLVMHK